MKKKIYLAVVAVALSVLATPVYAQRDCADSTTVTLLVSKYQLNLIDKAPVCITVARPVFAIRVVVAGNVQEMGKVKVSQKKSQVPRPITIDGDYDSASKLLLVSLSGTLNEGEVFEYFIEVEGVGSLDPKIRIIPVD
jgi:hypothetical protein